jgi:angio-associated migratory cell protein
MDGRTVVTVGGEGDGSVRIWDPKTGEAAAVVAAGHGTHDAAGGATSIAFAPDGAAVATGGADGAVVMVSITSGRAVARLHGVHDDGIEALAFVGEGAAGAGGAAPLLVSGGLDGRAVVRDVHAGTTRATCGHPAAVVALAPQHAGPLIATACTDGAVRLWDTRTAACVRTLGGHRAAVQCVAWSPDDARLLSGSDDCTACVFDVAA